MKKLKLLLFLIPLFFSISCEDNSGDYVNQLYTDNEMVTAIHQCVTACIDTANAHLSVPDSVGVGFYNYQDGKYRISLPQNMQYVIDTLVQHGESELVDNFIRKINVAASSCGGGIRNFVTNSLSNMDFISPLALLEKDSTAIVTYFYTMNYVGFNSAISTHISAQSTYNEAVSLWNEMCEKYLQYTEQNINFELKTGVVGQISAGIFEEMKLEEILIRTDSTHRGKIHSKMYDVFGNFEKR